MGVRFGRLVRLLILALVLLAACSPPRPDAGQGSDPPRPAPGPADPAPAAADPASGPAGPPSEQAGVMDPPTIRTHFESRRYAPGETVLIAVRPHYAHSVQIRFEQHLDLATARERLEVTPQTLVREIQWDQGTSTDGRDWAQGSIYFRDPVPGQTAEVTLRAGVRGQDGAVLADDFRFRVEFVESAHAQISLSGPGYLPGGRVVATSASPGPAAVFRPGPAELRITFSHPMDRAAVWQRVQEQLSRPELDQAGGAPFRLGEPAWDAAGRVLTVRLEQPAPPADPSVAHPRPRLELEGVLDARGLPLAPEGSALEWLVIRPLPLVRAGNAHGGGAPAGEIAALPWLQPASPAPVYSDRLLTWHMDGEGGECYSFALLAWDISDGAAVPVGHPQNACMTWAGWAPDGEAVLLVSYKELRRYDLPAASPLPAPDQLPAARVLYTAGEERILAGAAFAPDGRVALFESGPPVTADGPQRIDLVLVDAAGRVLERVGNVSDLLSSESIWKTIEAAWSEDGAALAFIRRRAGSGALLSIWRPEGLEETDVPAARVSWLPGTSLLITGSAPEGTLRLYDVQARSVRTREVPPPTPGYPIIWSPDGRRSAWMHGSEWLLVDWESGRTEPVGLPLGWGPAGFYWAQTP